MGVEDTWEGEIYKDILTAVEELPDILIAVEKLPDILTEVEKIPDTWTGEIDNTRKYATLKTPTIWSAAEDRYETYHIVNVNASYKGYIGNKYYEIGDDPAGDLFRATAFELLPYWGVTLTKVDLNNLWYSADSVPNPVSYLKGIGTRE